MSLVAPLNIYFFSQFCTHSLICKLICVLCKALNIFEPTSHLAGYLLWVHNIDPNLKLELEISIHRLTLLLLWQYESLQKGTGGVR